jgi:hypothetical protein
MMTKFRSSYINKFVNQCAEYLNISQLYPAKHAWYEYDLVRYLQKV